MLDFKERDYNDDEELLFAMEEIIVTKRQLKILEKQIFLYMDSLVGEEGKRNRLFQYQALRNVVKIGRDQIMKNIGEKFLELKVEGVQKKLFNMIYRGAESESKKRFSETQRFSKKRRVSRKINIMVMI